MYIHWPSPQTQLEPKPSEDGNEHYKKRQTHTESMKAENIDLVKWLGWAIFFFAIAVISYLLLA